MSEETKLAKFEVIVNDTFTWLVNSYGPFAEIGIDEWGLHFPFKADLYRPIFLDKYAFNPYVKKVLDGLVVDDNHRLITDIVQLIKAYKAYQIELEGYALSARDMMIFWMLFIAALDDEIYNNELDSIIDIAYCMDFDEAMIRDWCHAVEYVMQGNRFSQNCDLRLETEEGKRFFLHEGKSEVFWAVSNSVNSILREQNATITSILKDF